MNLTFNWKKTVIILVDCILAVYLVLAITAFNRPDELSDVCTEVNIHIENGRAKGFLNTNEIERQLKTAHLYPLGDLMKQVDVRKIEEALRQNPLVDGAQCYKTQTGRVNIIVSQRVPIIRIKAENGDDYYIDEGGNIMPNTHYANNVVVATGAIQRKYAQNTLKDIGSYLLSHQLWRSQVEQINVLADGSIEIIPRVGDHIVYFGLPTSIDKKFDRLEKFYKYGLSKAGWNKYSYISLEFSNQIICKKRTSTNNI